MQENHPCSSVIVCVFRVLSPPNLMTLGRAGVTCYFVFCMLLDTKKQNSQNLYNQHTCDM